MIGKLKGFLYDLRDRQRMAIAMSRGAAMMHARKVDLRRPATWEFSGFSQNGEDGIIDVLRSQLKNSNRYFIEIGTSDGIENNTAWLLVAEKFAGIMIEGTASQVERAKRVVIPHSTGAECYNMFVTRESISELQKLAVFRDPDVFSLDIDGNDYYLAKVILDGGFRPKIFVVEYNSAYGPDRNLTIEYQADFDVWTAHNTQLYYGVSVTAWRRFFQSRGYRFVTVDRNGVNAFFVDPAQFDAGFLDGISGLEFAENTSQLRRHPKGHESQFALISNQRLRPVDE